MTPYIWAGDDESTDMTSFTWQDAPAQTAPARATTYRVVWTWGEPETILTGLNKETADATAEGLNATAARYGHGKEYSVEEE